MNKSSLDMRADYRRKPDMGAAEIARKRELLDILRAMSHDHRYNLDTRLACMAQLLDDNRELWCRA